MAGTLMDFRGYILSSTLTPLGGQALEELVWGGTKVTQVAGLPQGRLGDAEHPSLLEAALTLA